MLASYAVIMRRSAVVTAPAAVAMVVLSTVLGGAKGLAGSLLGVALVIIFFGISTVAVSRAAQPAGDDGDRDLHLSHQDRGAAVLRGQVQRHHRVQRQALRADRHRLRAYLDHNAGSGLRAAQGSVRRAGRETVTSGVGHASGQRLAARRPSLPGPGDRA